jgi:hypothetical protein
VLKIHPARETFIGNPTMQTTKSIALSFLSAKQLQAAANLAEMSSTELTLTATAGRGAARKVAAQIVADNSLGEVLAQYEASKCSRPEPLARYVRAYVGQYESTDKLQVCPFNRAGFEAYPHALQSWALSSENEKTQSARLKVAAHVESVVKLAAQAYDNMKAQEAAAQEAAAQEAAAQEAAAQEAAAQEAATA